MGVGVGRTVVLCLCWLAAQAVAAVTPEEIAKDADVRALVEYQLAIKERHGEAFARLAEKERATLLEDVDRVFVDGKTDSKELASIAERTGVTREEISRLSELAAAVVKKYPELAKKGAMETLRPAFFGRAAGESRALRFCLFCSEYELHPIDPDYVSDPCLKACHDALVAQNEQIFLEHHLALLVCAGPLVFPGPGTVVSLGCFFEEQVRALIRYSVAEATYENCRERCFAAAAADGRTECDESSDCDEGEYCYLFDGPLNNPIAEPYCRPQKAERSQCRYDYECSSGCCKFYAWWSLSHDVCRPDDKCD